VVMGAAALLATLLVVLPGCATSNAIGLARQACVHVNRSLVLYEHSRTEDGAHATADANAAMNQLREGLPDAATAAGEDGQFQGLMTTLAESARIPESNLVNALQDQCQSVGS